MARRWDVISWSGRTGSLNGGPPTLADSRRDVTATGQAGGKGRPGQVEAICYWWSVAASYQVMLPPKGGPGALRCGRYRGTHYFRLPTWVGGTESKVS